MSKTELLRFVRILPQLGKAFTEQTLDGRTVQTNFSFSGQTLIQEQVLPIFWMLPFIFDEGRKVHLCDKITTLSSL